jgi:hypothetical protein
VLKKRTKGIGPKIFFKLIFFLLEMLPWLEFKCLLSSNTFRMSEPGMKPPSRVH